MELLPRVSGNIPAVAGLVPLAAVWIEYHPRERKHQWRGFKQSLEHLRDTGLEPQQGEVRTNTGLTAWSQTHMECFTQDPNMGTRNWHGPAEPHPKRPRQAGPGVLHGVQNRIAELVAKRYIIVYTNGSSKTLSHKDMRRAGGFGVFAPQDEQGPEAHFCGYVPTRHGQTNNGAELWAALEALQGFWVSKLAILTDSQHLQLGATGRAQNWKSKGWTTTSSKLQVHVPVWEMLLHEREKPCRDVRRGHVPAHVNVQRNEVANGLAMAGMCFSPLWSKQVQQDSSDSESTFGLRGGSVSESDDTKALWASLGMVPMDSDEMMGEACRELAPHGTESCNSGSEE